MAFSTETSRWAGQLSLQGNYHYNLSSLQFEFTIKLAQSLLKKCSINPCFFELYSDKGEITNVYEAFRFGIFFDYEHWDFLTRGFRCSHPSDLHFAVFSTWATHTSEMTRYPERRVWKFVVESVKWSCSGKRKVIRGKGAPYMTK